MNTELAIAQLAAYVALTAGSLTVAVVTLILNYRQHRGWEPLLILTSRGFMAQGEHPSVSFATLTFEFWNRRKYPVHLRRVEVSFFTIKIEDFPIQDGWILSSNRKVISTLPDTVTDQAMHRKFTIAAPFAKGSSDKLESAMITATYYDPVKIKHKKVVISVDWIPKT